MKYTLHYSKIPEGFPISGRLEVLKTDELQKLPIIYPNIGFWIMCLPKSKYCIGSYYNIKLQQLDFKTEFAEALIEKIGNRFAIIGEIDIYPYISNRHKPYEYIIFEMYMMYMMLFGKYNRDAILWITREIYQHLSNRNDATLDELTIHGQFSWYMIIKRIVSPYLQELRKHYDDYNGMFALK